MSYPEWSPDSKVGDKVWWGTTLYVVESAAERVVLKRAEPITFRKYPWPESSPRRGTKQ